MPKLKVKVKWDRQVFSDLELDTDDSPDVFKSQLFSLTGVPTDRQKLLLKGTVVKDTWEGFSIPPNASFIMLGSKTALPVEPVIKTIFLEDMTESELSKASKLPPGLTNLGNTCYINATIQCFRMVPELRTTLKKFKGSFNYNQASKENFVLALRDQYELMDKGLTSPPLGIIHSLHELIPRFSEKDSTGKWRQQDANEFWVELINILQEVLPPPVENDNRTTIDQYLSGNLKVEYSCLESDSEPKGENEDKFFQLSCFINPEVRYLQQGLQSSLIEKITKHSVTLNRDAIFQKSCKIDRLPAYLTIQLVRFYYKGKENINAKVLRDIKFSIRFDAFELCTPELQKRLTEMRKKIIQQEDQYAREGKGALSDEQHFEPFSFPDDVGSSNSGIYELQAVLTHQGRSSSSGHYVAWINLQGMWIKCDDAEISVVSEESVLKLSGGGDWHMAYILLYGPKTLVSTAKVSEG